jgi:ribosomal protein S18 acetylase RimI-like enzyme
MSRTGRGDVVLRTRLRRSDRRAIARLVRRSGNFTPAEVAVAIELVDERLARGDASGYRFLLAECQGRVAGYACYGRIPGTTGSYDLYWLVVATEFQGRGIGRTLLRAAEAAIRRARGRTVYVDTSSLPQYERARRVYTSAGYQLAARLPDFYAPGDDKLVYARDLRPAARRPDSDGHNAA